MPRLVYLDAAKQDLIAIAHFIKKESSSSSIAVEYTKRIRVFCRGLTAPETSQRGTDRSELLPNIRSEAFGNYVIFFRYKDDRLEIVNILEGHRDIAFHFTVNPPI